MFVVTSPKCCSYKEFVMMLLNFCQNIDIKVSNMSNTKLNVYKKILREVCRKSNGAEQ